MKESLITKFFIDLKNMFNKNICGGVMKYKIISIIVLVIIMLPISVFANDASLGRMGETVYPMEEANVEMVSEDIYVNSNGEVKCEFVFRNLGEEKTVLMGFPATLDLTHENMTTEENVTLKNFTAFLNGDSIEVELKEGISIGENFAKFPYWYVFEVPFKENETLILNHTYDVFFTSFSNSEIAMGYVLKTGATWKNNIGHTKVTFDLSEFHPWGILFEYGGNSVENFKYIDGKLIYENWDYKPENDIKLAIMRYSLNGGDFPIKPQGLNLLRKNFFDQVVGLEYEEALVIYNKLNEDYEKFIKENSGTFGISKFIDVVYMNTLKELNQNTNPKTGYKNLYVKYLLISIGLGVTGIILKVKKYPNSL